MSQPKHHFIQYGKQTIDQSDIDAVSNVFKENAFLTTGPRVAEFEQQVCQMIGCKYAIAVNSGTAALHCAMYAIDIKQGDQVIVPPMTFAATSNCVVYQGGTPVFCDIDSDTLNIDSSKIEALITAKTKAVIMVDYAGQPADYHRIREICTKHQLYLIEDSAHTIGLQIKECPNQQQSNQSETQQDNQQPTEHSKIYVGNFADITCFSFHPVKNMTTGEGGMMTTNNQILAKKMQRFRTHGITTEYQNRKMHAYDIPELGFNYRLTDFQCALGTNQLKRLPEWIARRQEIARIYDRAFQAYQTSTNNLFKPLMLKSDSAYHLYVIRLNLENLDCDRDTIFDQLKQRNLGVNVHYVPTHHLTYYQEQIQKGAIPPANCPITDQIYQEIITLPLYPTLTNQEIEFVIQDTIEVISSHKKPEIMV